MTTARDRHLSTKLTLEILIRQVLRKVGGTGCDLSDELYIAQQVKEWSNSRERLLMAIACFEDLKKTCQPAKKDTLRDEMESKPERNTMAKEKQETTRRPDARPGFIVCGVFTRSDGSSTS